MGLHKRDLGLQRPLDQADGGVHFGRHQVSGGATLQRAWWEAESRLDGLKDAAKVKGGQLLHAAWR